MTRLGRLQALADAITAVGAGEVAPGPPRPVFLWPQGVTERLQPYGPDPVVFGCPKPPLPLETLGGPRMRTCRACQVQWAGDGPCWYCGGRNRND